MAVYYGFSTVSSNSQKKFVLTDSDLIKQDLMNAFMTTQGSRLMQPSFGCIAWNQLFENVNSNNVQLIVSNITEIVNSDPRVSLVSIDVTPTNNNIVVTLILKYTQTNQIDQMVINFNNQNSPLNSY